MTDLYKAIVFPETSPSKIPQGAALRIVTKKTRPSSFRYCTSSSSLRSFRSFVTLVFLVLSTNLGKSPIGIPRSGVLLLLLFVSSYKRNVRNASTRGWLFFSEHHCFGAELSKIYACITAWVCGIQKSLPTFLQIWDSGHRCFV